MTHEIKTMSCRRKKTPAVGNVVPQRAWVGPTDPYEIDDTSPKSVSSLGRELPAPREYVTNDKFTEKVKALKEVLFMMENQISKLEVKGNQLGVNSDEIDKLVIDMQKRIQALEDSYQETVKTIRTMKGGQNIERRLKKFEQTILGVLNNFKEDMQANIAKYMATIHAEYAASTIRAEAAETAAAELQKRFDSMQTTLEKAVELHAQKKTNEFIDVMKDTIIEQVINTFRDNDQTFQKRLDSFDDQMNRKIDTAKNNARDTIQQFIDQIDTQNQAEIRKKLDVLKRDLTTEVNTIREAAKVDLEKVEKAKEELHYMLEKLKPYEAVQTGIQTLERKLLDLDTKGGGSPEQYQQLVDSQRKIQDMIERQDAAIKNLTDTFVEKYNKQKQRILTLEQRLGMNYERMARQRKGLPDEGPSRGRADPGAVPALPTRWDFKEFRIIKTIGEGSFGKVVQARWKDRVDFIVKIISRKNQSSVNAELAIAGEDGRLCQDDVLKCAEHVNYYVGHGDDSENFYLYSFDLKLTSLDKTVKNKKWLGTENNNGWFDTKKKQHELMRHLLEDLQFIHSRRIVHADIKPENIVVNLEETPITTLFIDFGGSRIIPERNGDFPVLLSGSLLFLDPVLFFLRYRFVHTDVESYWKTLGITRPPNANGFKTNYNPFLSDIWSLGVTFLEMPGLEYTLQTFVLSYMTQYNPKMRLDSTKLLEKLSTFAP